MSRRHPRRGKLRTYVALGYTLVASGRVVARAALGRLDDHGDALIQQWADDILTIAGVDLVVQGREHLDAAKPQMLMSNHRSLLDIPAVFKAAGRPVRAIAKEELRSVPLFGQAIEKTGNVFVDRSNRERAKAQLKKTRYIAESQMALWVSAEGTRAKTDTLLPLKMGGFHVARELGMPIVPTWIAGTAEVIPAGTWEAQPGQTVTVSFGPPVDPTEYEHHQIRALARRVRDELVRLSGRPDPFPEDCVTTSRKEVE